MPSPSEFQQRYIGELIAASVVLESFETAAQAEAWVSGAIAEWRALDGPEAMLERELRAHAPVVADLLCWFDGGERPQGALAWMADLGRHQLARVLRLAEADAGNEQVLIFEYQLDGEADHDLSVSVVDGTLLGVSVGPAGLADGIDEDAESALTVAEIDGAAARQLVAIALAGPHDQLSPASEANVPLLAKRIGGTVSATTEAESSRVLPDRDADDDKWCVGVVRSSLRKILENSAPDTVEIARTSFAAAVAERAPDALTVLEVAGIGPGAAIDELTFLDAVGSYFKPVDLSAHTDAQFEALTELEPVDWAGAILGVVRSPATAPPIDGDVLVTYINRAPEITSSIPKSDAPRLAWTFEQMLFAWEVTGVIDDEGRVTDAGRWLLANAFVRTLDN